MSLLQITDLQKSYASPDGEVQPMLDVPEFRMASGEQVALAGASGSGKTTLLHVIAGILRPDAGRVVVAGTELSALGEARRDAFRALHLGYVYQTFNLLQGYTALENVLLGMMFGAGPDPGYARALLAELDLADRMDYRPAQLSIGQQQRVAVARALANRPQLVLADEPTGNLDHRRAHESLDLMCRSCQEHGAALLVVSHDRSILDRFGEVHDLAEINRVPSAIAAAGPEGEER